MPAIWKRKWPLRTSSNGHVRQSRGEIKQRQELWQTEYERLLKKINKQRIKSWKLDSLLYLWLWLGIANDKSFLWQDCVTCLTHGIDISKVKWVSKGSTPAYVFISDPDGDMAVAVCDAEISSEISPEYLKEHLDMLNHATAVVVGTNLWLCIPCLEVL